MSTNTNTTLSNDNNNGNNCWICLQSDDQKSLIRACSCSLKSHESCLLNWIQYKQSQHPLERVLCPQCQFQYILLNKNYYTPFYLLKILKQLDVFIEDLTPFILMIGMGGAIWISSTFYGAYAALFFAGPNFANILFSNNHDSNRNWNWRVWIGLPLIPATLIASRTSNFESVVHLLPLVILDKKNSYINFNNNTRTMLRPAHVLAAMPMVRLIYNFLYEAIIGKHMRQWEFEINNRQYLNPSLLLENNNQNNPHNQIDHEDIIQHNNTNNNDSDVVVIGSEYRIKIRTVIGALAFPFIASFVGTILGNFEFVRKRVYLTLYRNIIGGCVFVVLKDMLNVFYKYNLAKQGRHRRIKTFDD